MKGVLGYVEDDVFSSNIAIDNRSLLFNAKSSIAITDKLLKVVFWINR